MSNEVIEGNKLIAEFMGLKIGDAWQVWNKKADYTNRTEFEYHTSWDWLMPVVEKANNICSKNGNELSNHSRDQQHLEDPLDNPRHWKSWSYHYIHLSTNRERVWQSVVEFIKWYNQNNSK